MDLVGDGRDEAFQKDRGRRSSGLLDQLHEGEFAGAINRDVEVKLALGSLNLGDIDMEVTDRIGLKLFLAGLSPSRSGSRLMP